VTNFCRKEKSENGKSYQSFPFQCSNKRLIDIEKQKSEKTV
jgi:hypothetical protein